MGALAVAVLGVTYKEFYDLSPAEFYYALEAVRNYRKAQSQEAWEIARFQTVLTVNCLPNQLKGGFVADPRKLIRFDWEEAIDSVQQDAESMKAAVLGIAARIGAKVVQRHPDDPPTNPVQKTRK